MESKLQNGGREEYGNMMQEGRRKEGRMEGERIRERLAGKDRREEGII